MVEPKIFYRKLDSLLKRIGKERTGKNFLFSIVKELENMFGSDLHIADGRIYEDHGDEFVLLGPPRKAAVSKRTPARMPADSEAVQHVLRFGSYIYDDPTLSIDSEVSMQYDYAIPAAFTVRSPEDRWIFVFELKAGWVREEIEFCMNAVRTAVNYRLFSDAINSDLEQAAHIQQSLLPANPPDMQGYQIAARSQPAEIVGGDLYDFFLYSDQMFGVSIGDASGHGLPAALLVRDVVTGLRMGLEEQMKMVHTLKRLNRVIHRSTYSTRFVSLFYGEIESDGHLIYANAGHPTPLLVKGNEVHELETTGMILGALPEIDLHRAYAHVEPDSLLVLYSDGLLERQNHKQEVFGLARLKKLVAANQNKNAQEILEVIFESIYAYGNHGRWEDDATVVVIKRLGNRRDRAAHSRSAD